MHSLKVFYRSCCHPRPATNIRCLVVVRGKLQLGSVESCRYPRERGDLSSRSYSHEIPACAGKTRVFVIPAQAGMTKEQHPIDNKNSFGMTKA